MPDGRPQIERRSDYLPRSPQDGFIVPLLKVAIEVQIDRLLSPGQSKNAPRVLDAGCGAQPCRARVEKTGASYYSLDVCAQSGVKVDFIAPIDEKRLPESIYQSGPYDLILCSDVLEHVAEWDNLFANFYHSLAPSGHIILTSPHFFPLHEEPYDFWRPTPYSIRYLAQKHGFAIETEAPLGTGVGCFRNTSRPPELFTPHTLLYFAFCQSSVSGHAALVICPVAFEASSGHGGGSRSVLSGEFLCSAKG